MMVVSSSYVYGGEKMKWKRLPAGMQCVFK